MPVRKNPDHPNLRKRLAASFRERARYWEERLSDEWDGWEDMTAHDNEMADRIEAGETVTVQGSDLATLVYRRAVDVPSFVIVHPDGSIEPTTQREEP